MNYFAILFPNSMTFIVKTAENWSAEDVVNNLHSSNGLSGVGNDYYNPRQFISVTLITPDERQKSLSRELRKVLI